MRLTPEQIAEEKKCLSEFKEMLWFGEHVLTSIEQDLFDTIEALQQEVETLQQENKKLNAALNKAAGMMGESRCPIDSNSRKCSDFEDCLHCWKDWLLGEMEVHQ